MVISDGVDAVFVSNNKRRVKMIGEENTRLTGCDPVERPQVSMNLERLDGTLNQLGERIQALNGKLSPVLRPESPVCSEKPEKEGGLVEIAQVIYSQNKTAQNCIAAVEDILNRLEL